MTTRFDKILIPIMKQVEHIFMENELSKEDVFMIVTNLVVNLDHNLQVELIETIEDYRKNNLTS